MSSETSTTGHSPVVVVGGGLTGLVAAYRLAEAGHGVTVVEAEPRFGGQIYSHREDGLLVELGAEGFVARSKALPRLAEDLGLADALIDQETTLTYALGEDGHTLTALEPGEAARILGFQVPKEELGRGIRSFSLGMGQLIDALVATLKECGVELRAATPVSSIQRDGGGLRLSLESDSLAADAVVVTVPARHAVNLLEPLVGEAARGLGSGRLLSNASATLVYNTPDIGRTSPLDGSGFIVPAAAQKHGFRACSFVTTKFKRDIRPDATIVRVFFRPTEDDLHMDDQAWIARAHASVTPPLELSAEPVAAWASVWPRALPVYDDDYRAAVTTADDTLREHRVWLAGSHFHGAGIDAAVISAERAAAAIAELEG